MKQYLSLREAAEKWGVSERRINQYCAEGPNITKRALAAALRELMAFVRALKNNAGTEKRVELLKEICEYFYENRKFYRKALKIEGQNSFSEHFREYCQPLIRLRLTYLIGEDRVDDFAVNFYTDAVLCAMERWLMDKNCMPPDQFLSKMLLLIQSGANAIHRETSQLE